MRAKIYLPLVGFIVLATSAAVYLVSRPQPKIGGIALPSASELSESQAIHKKIDELVVRVTGEMGYTHAAAEKLVQEINQLGNDTHAELKSDGNIEVQVKGSQLPRIIAMNKLDIGEK